jgi:hypothetical protein
MIQFVWLCPSNLRPRVVRQDSERATMSDNNVQSIQQPNPDEVKHRSILGIRRELNVDA